MKRLLFLLGLVGVLLAPTVGWAVDGDQCDDSDNANIPLFTRGGWIAVSCIQLCDGKAAADSACTEYDFATRPGMPDIIVFEYEENPDDANCGGSTPDFTLTTGPVSVVATANAPTYDISTSTIVMNAATNRVILITEGAPLDRFLFTAIADDASCTDVDIRMFFYNRKTSMF